jgi:hypothetical protein
MGWMFRVSKPGREQEISSSLKRPDWLWSPPRFPFYGYWAPIPKGKVAIRLLPQVKNEWIKTSAPSLRAFMAWAGTALVYISIRICDESVLRDMINTTKI